VFSTTFRYALISLLDLAQAEHTLQSRQIAESHSLSSHYLSVVLRELRRLGLVESIKGNRGGYRLGRPADQINLLELHNALAGRDGSGAEEQAGRGHSAADAWLVQLAERWSRDLATATLADLQRIPAPGDLRRPAAASANPLAALGSEQPGS
jgi:Rrf2 family protein